MFLTFDYFITFLRFEGLLRFEGKRQSKGILRHRWIEGFRGYPGSRSKYIEIQQRCPQKVPPLWLLDFGWKLKMSRKAKKWAEIGQKGQKHPKTRKTLMLLKSNKDVLKISPPPRIHKHGGLAGKKALFDPKNPPKPQKPAKNLKIGQKSVLTAFLRLSDRFVTIFLPRPHFWP